MARPGLFGLIGVLACGCYGGSGGSGGGGGGKFGGGSRDLPGTISAPGSGGGLPGTTESGREGGLPGTTTVGDGDQDGVFRPGGGSDDDAFDFEPSSGGGRGPSSGVSKGKRLDSLSPSEEAALCEVVFEYVDDLLNNSAFARGDCLQEALQEALFSGSGDPIEVCEEALDNCDSGFSPNFGPGDCDVNIPAECAATVGDIEDCLDDSLDALEDAFARLSCDLAGDPDAFEAFNQPKNPKSCDRLQDRCPGIDTPNSGF